MGAIENDADNVKEAISSWDPGPSFSERRCHDSLERHLRNKFPKHTVVREHPVGRGRADLFIDFKDWTGFGAKVIVEVKYNLSDLNEYHRLVGQMHDYVTLGDAEPIIVLCGNTKSEIAALVVERMAHVLRDRWFEKGAVIQMPITARAGNGRFINRTEAR